MPPSGRFGPASRGTERLKAAGSGARRFRNDVLYTDGGGMQGAGTLGTFGGWGLGARTEGGLARADGRRPPSGAGESRPLRGSLLSVAGERHRRERHRAEGIATPGRRAPTPSPPDRAPPLGPARHRLGPAVGASVPDGRA